MQIKTVKIDRFKNLSDVQFDLDKINIFVGSNNSGKSSVIQAVHLGFSLLQSMEFANKWPAANDKSRTVSPSDLVYVPSSDAYALGSGGRLLEDADKAIELSYLLSDGRELALKIRKGRITNLIVELSDVALAKELTDVDKPLSIFSPGLAGVARNENRVSNGVVLRALARGDANVVLRNILLRLQQNNKFDAFHRDLVEVFPAIEIVSKFDDNIDEYIEVRIRNEGGSIIPLDLSGAGLLQAIQILSYFHLYSPKLILLDEPDSHLHPNNQRLLCSLLSKMTEEQDVQAIMTTHSRHVLDALYSDARVIWMQEGRAKLAGVDSQVDILMDIGALDIKERLSKGDFDIVFVTEDKRKGLLHKLLDANGFDIARTLLLSYGGVSNTHVLQILMNAMRELTDKKVIAHRDRDYLTNDEMQIWKQRVIELGCEPFVTAGTDVESYFCTEAYVNASWPGHAAEVRDLLRRVREELNEDSIGDYVNGRVEIERKSGNAKGLDPGALAIAGHRLSAAEPGCLIKGKKQLGRIRKLMQDEHQISLGGLADKSLISADLRSILKRAGLADQDN